MTHSPKRPRPPAWLLLWVAVAGAWQGVRSRALWWLWLAAAACCPWLFLRCTGGGCVSVGCGGGARDETLVVSKGGLVVWVWDLHAMTS